MTSIALYLIVVLVQFFLGALAAGTFVLLIFMFLAPFLISNGWLVNKPTKDGPSGPHLFTQIGPGDVKWIIRGKTPIRAIENTGGLRFERKGTDRQTAEYWNIIEGPDEREDLFKEIWWPLRLWARYVFMISGCVFTGIWPFQRVYEYKLNRIKIVTDEINLTPGKENPTRLIPVQDYSDHFRNRMFQDTLLIEGAETLDKIPLNILLIFEGRVVNPYLTAYNNDGWDNALSAIIKARISQKTRSMKLDDVLTALNDDHARALSDAVIPRNKNLTVKKEHEITKVIGILPIDVKILEIDPVGTPEQLEQLRAHGFSLQKAKATRADGQARADVVTMMKTAEGDDGGLALTLEARVKMTEAAAKGGNLILLDMGGDTKANQIEVAQLDALRRKGAAQTPPQTEPQPGDAVDVSATEPEGN